MKLIHLMVNSGCFVFLLLVPVGTARGGDWADWNSNVSVSLAPYDIFSGNYNYTYGADGATLTPNAGHQWPNPGNPFAHQANAITPGSAEYPLPATCECKVLMPSVSAAFDWGWLNSGVVYYSCAIRYRTYNASGQIVDDGIYSWVNGQTFAAMGCPASIYTANPVTLVYTITSDLKFIVGAKTDAAVWFSPPLTPGIALSVGGPSTVYGGKGILSTPAGATAVDATDPAQAILKIQAVQAYEGVPAGFPTPTPTPVPTPPPSVEDPWWWSGNTFYYMLGGGCPPGHPEMVFKNSAGAIAGTVCYNSPAYKSYVTNYLKNYAIQHPAIETIFLDGVWWDGYGENWCCCDYCKQAYRSKFGRNMPVFDRLRWGMLTPSEMRDAIEWRRDSLEAVYQNIVTQVKAVRPDLSIVIHGIGTFMYETRDPGLLFSRITCLRMSDIVYAENYLNETFWTAWLRGVARRPFAQHTPYLQDSYQVQPPLEPYVGDVFKAALAGMLANGCYKPVTSISGGANCENARLMFDLVEKDLSEKQQYVAGASPILYAAIVFSEDVNTYYGRGDAGKWFVPNMQGAFELLERLHIPVEFLGNLDLNLANLKKFKVVILPNLAILSPSQVLAIRQYVNEGGSILATYETGLYDAAGGKKAGFDLSDVFGLRYTGTNPGATPPTGNALNPQGDLLRSLQKLLAPIQNRSLHVIGPFITSEPTAGTTQATYTNFPLWPQAQQTNIPAVHYNRLGNGKSAYVSMDLFQNYAAGPEDSPAVGFKAYPFGRKGWTTELTGEILDWLAPNPPFKVEGSPLLACTFFEQKQPERLIVHLVNTGVTKLGMAFTLDPARILVQKDIISPVRASTVWPETRELNVVDKGAYLEIDVPATRIHQIVIIERQKASAPLAPCGG